MFIFIPIKILCVTSTSAVMPFSLSLSLGDSRGTAATCKTRATWALALEQKRTNCLFTPSLRHWLWELLFDDYNYIGCVFYNVVSS